MILSTILQPLDEAIQVSLDEFIPEERSSIFAEFADEVIDDAANELAAIFGHAIGRILKINDQPSTAPNVEAINSAGGLPPNAEVEVEFDLVDEVLLWIADQLEQHSPVGSGKDPHPGLYKKSHILYADGVEVELLTASFLDSREYVFVNAVPYARKIELGSSSQAPDGVYQAVATLAQQQFGDIATISFSYRTATEGVIIGGRKGNRPEGRNPAVIVRPYGV